MQIGDNNFGSEINSSKPKILIVEDDVDLNNLLKYTLEVTQDYQVFSLFSGEEAIEKVQSIKPELLILDVMLPGIWGTDILKYVRNNEPFKFTPVILLTARTQEQDKIDGFEAGADDYITKPFSPKELVLRVQAILRRINSLKQSFLNLDASKSLNPAISVGAIVIYPKEYKVLINNESVSLTLTEFQLLLFLAENAGKLQSREVLLQKVWGYEGNVNTRTVDTHIKRLRQKLGKVGSLIETVHGFGYQLVQ